MARTVRICAQCSGTVQIEDQFCPACGSDTMADLMAYPATSLKQRAMAAVPTVLAVGFVVLRLGGGLLGNPLLQRFLSGSRHRLPATERGQTAMTGKRLHVRRRWRIRHRDGQHSSGEAEETYTFS